MDKFLLTDVDGVLLNWLDPFLRYMDTKKIRKTGEQHMDFHKLQNLYHDTTKEEIHDFIEDFNTSHHFAELKPIKEAEIVLPTLKERHDFKVIAITSSNVDLVSTTMRRINLEQHYGDIIEDVIFVERLQSKQEVLESFPTAYWIEDFVPNALAGFVAGHTAIVLEHIYNEKDRYTPNVHFKEDWKEVQDFIRYIEKSWDD